MYTFLVIVIIFVLIAYKVLLNRKRRKEPVIEVCEHEEINDLSTFENPYKRRCNKCGKVFNSKRRE